MNGAALSTLIVLLFFNTVKIWYVKKRFNIYPFTRKTVYLLLILTAVYSMFFFWNFNLHPILNIVLKGALISVSYLILVYKLNISSDINTIINKFIKSNQ